MRDRIPQYPGRVRLTPVAGQDGVFDLTMADDAAEQGTPLNKATFLKDTTAALYGLTNAVPNDVFSFIGKDFGNMWVWAKQTSSIHFDEKTVSGYSFSSSQYFHYADSFTLDSSGKFVLTNPSYIYFDHWGDYTTLKNTLNGKYVCFLSSATYSATTYLLKVNDDTTFYHYQSQSIYADNIVNMSNPRIVYATVSYVNSPDPNAYPPAIPDGYTYATMGQLGNKTQIATGSYIGTGNYGAINPNSLTFDFEPKFIWIYAERAGTGINTYKQLSSAISTVPMEYIPTQYAQYFPPYYSDSTYAYSKKSNDGKTLYWYHTQTAEKQLNNNKHEYFYLAIG